MPRSNGTTERLRFSLGLEAEAATASWPCESAAGNGLAGRAARLQLLQDERSWRWAPVHLQQAAAARD